MFDFELSGMKVGEQMETEVTVGGIVRQIIYISANSSYVSLCSAYDLLQFRHEKPLLIE